MSCLLVLAGGTGGHVFPALAVARLLKAQGVQIVWLGTRRGLEARVVPAAGFDIEWVSIEGLRRTRIISWISLPFRLLIAMWQAWRVVRRRKPDAALAMGGFVSGPGGLVCWLTRTPLVIHEQNAVAGLTNRWLALLAREKLCGFPNAFRELPGTVHVGNPVREDILALAPPEQRYAAHTGACRVLIVGGSQGALVFNRVVPEALALVVPQQRPSVWHQAGRTRAAATQERYTAAGLEAKVTEFIDDMAAAYAWADVVICRAGAMTVAEISAAGIAAVFVPYPFATDDHQTANARFLAQRGAALLVPEKEFTPAYLAQLLQSFAGARAGLQKMALEARKCAMPDATQQVARRCREVLNA